MKRSNKVLTILLTCILIIALAVGIPLAFYLLSDDQDTYEEPIHECSFVEDASRYQAPSCLEFGQRVEVCTCGAEKITQLDALGHDYVEHEAQAATCTEAGWAAYKECSRCHDTNKVELAAIGHEMTILVDAQAPTCTSVGWNAYAKCTRCDHDTKEEISALGHTYEHFTGLPATCTTDGYTDYKTCSVCGVSDRQEIAAFGHSPVQQASTAPTCQAAGIQGAIVCDTCEVTLEKAIRLPQLDCRVEVYNIAATCTTDGYIGRQVCVMCKEIKAEGTKVDKLNHPAEYIETIPGKAATCDAPGMTEGKYCKLCGEMTQDRELITQLNHTEVILPRVEATCSSTGLTAGKYCSDCGKILERQETIELVDHTEIVIPGKTPTCSRVGYTESKYCTVCATVTYPRVEIPALAHPNNTDIDKWLNGNYVEVDEFGNTWYITFDGLRLNNVKLVAGTEATCTENGFTASAFCTDCGETLKASTTTSKKAHNRNGIIPAVAATCSTIGWTEGIYCTDCGFIHKTQEMIKTTAHTYVTIPAVEPTCSETGWTEGKKCSACNMIVQEPAVIPATGSHTTELVPGTQATCMTAGVGDSYQCSHCGTLLISGAIIPALGHTFEDFDCIRCDAQRTETSAGLAYTLSADESYYIVTGIGTCADADVWIPATHDAKPVKEIAANAFKSNVQIVRIRISEGIEKIGESAFDGCDSLVKVELPASLTEIGVAAFFNCEAVAEMTYEGTAAQWAIVSLGADWNFAVRVTVTCKGVAGI